MLLERSARHRSRLAPTREIVDQFFDTIRGGLGNDRLYGGLENDAINGDAGSDLLIGGSGKGRDVLIGGAWADSMAGGDDDDIVIAGGLLVDLVAGGTATDSTLVHDAYDEVLAAVRAQWSSTGIASRFPLQSTGVTTPLGSTTLDVDND